MEEDNMQYSFWQKITLDFIPLLKWPMIILLVWLILPSDFGDTFKKFAKDNNVKKLGFGNTVLEMDPNQQLKEIKKANEKANLSENTKDALKQLSSTADKQSQEHILKLEAMIESLEKQSSTILNNTSKIFVPNSNLDQTFNKEKAMSFNYEIYKKGELVVDISVGFDSLPFEYEFDLCDLSGHYKNLKLVKYDPNRTVTGLIYTDEKVNCKSSVSVTKLDSDSYLYAYELNVLDGFNIAKVDGFDVFLPLTKHRSISNSIYSAGGNDVVASTYRKGEVYEKTLVYIK